jgi:acetyltransferase (GNAT) family protein
MSFDYSLVKKTNSPACFRQVERIYLASFPVLQIRPTRMIIRMLEFDPNYHLFLVRQCNTVVGFSLLYLFNELNAAFLDFIAIDTTYRDRGLGSNLLRFTLNESKLFVANSIGMIFEIERERMTEHDKNKFIQSRVKFYRTFGTKTFDNVHYMLPNLHRGNPQDMDLMIIPNRELAYLEKSFVIRIIESVYRTIYHYLDDSNLLDLTTKGLPQKISLN